MLCLVKSIFLFLSNFTFTGSLHFTKIFTNFENNKNTQHILCDKIQFLLNLKAIMLKKISIIKISFFKVLNGLNWLVNIFRGIEEIKSIILLIFRNTYYNLDFYNSQVFILTISLFFFKLNFYGVFKVQLFVKFTVRTNTEKIILLTSIEKTLFFFYCIK